MPKKMTMMRRIAPVMMAARDKPCGMSKLVSSKTDPPTSNPFSLSKISDRFANSRFSLGRTTSYSLKE